MWTFQFTSDSQFHPFPQFRPTAGTPSFLLSHPTSWLLQDWSRGRVSKRSKCLPFKFVLHLSRRSKVGSSAEHIWGVPPGSHTTGLPDPTMSSLALSRVSFWDSYWSWPWHSQCPGPLHNRSPSILPSVPWPPWVYRRFTPACHVWVATCLQNSLMSR